MRQGSFRGAVLLILYTWPDCAYADNSNTGTEQRNPEVEATRQTVHKCAADNGAVRRATHVLRAITAAL